MYRKVTHLEFRAIEVFMAFVQYRRTQTWFSGVEISEPLYKGKPSDGDKRIVTVWQGSKNIFHQKLAVHFFHVEEFGGWNINGLIFAGKSMQPLVGPYDWQQAYRGGQRYDADYSWKFVPVRFDGRYFKDYDLSDSAQNEEFTQACKGRFPHVLPS